MTYKCLYEGSGVMLKIIFIKAPFQSILTILSFICFIFIVFLVNYNFLSFPFINIIIFAIPFCLFAIMTYIKVNQRMNKKACLVITIILAVILPVVMFFNYIFMILNQSTSEVTDIHKYDKVLSMYGYPDNKSMAHFPSNVPSNAENIRFYERPQFLQGGSSVFLLYKTSEQELTSYYNKYKGKVQIELENCSQPSYSYDNDYWIPEVWKEAIGYDSIPDDFKVMIIDSKPYYPKNWNHGYSYGLALSNQRKEIFFWSEDW